MDDKKLSKRDAKEKGKPEVIQTPTKEELEVKKTQLQNFQFDVLDHGFIRLVDMMGSDRDIIEAARLTSQRGSRTDEEDRGLIRYLMRHRHSTPIEMVELKFHVKCPMDVWRQWIRHRTATVNEYSTRYSPAIDDKMQTDSEEWRLQSKQNRQGSSAEFVTEWPENLPPMPHEILKDTPGKYLSFRENQIQRIAKDVYEERVQFGVALEQARKDLPLSTYTEACWKIDLHNLLHFLGLRMDAHAQKEIRAYADIIGKKIVAELLPWVWEAFEDYRLNAMFLTALDLHVINRLAHFFTPGIESHKYDQAQFSHCIPEEWNKKVSRERDECKMKLIKMGLLE